MQTKSSQMHAATLYEFFLKMHESSKKDLRDNNYKEGGTLSRTEILKVYALIKLL
jgi:hypothetical protein